MPYPHVLAGLPFPRPLAALGRARPCRRFTRRLLPLLLAVLSAAGTGPASHLFAQSLEERLLAEPAAALADEARSSGDPNRGAAIFHSRVLACSTCHRWAEDGPSIGPNLAQSNAELLDEVLVEAILLPSKRIAKPFATIQVTTTSGQVLTGTIEEESDTTLVLRSAAKPGERVTVKKDEIEERHQSDQSIMPAGQVNQLGERRNFIDLVRYLMEVRDGGIERARQLQPPPDPLAQTVPDEPSPFRPVVQRGEMQIGDAHYPHAVSLGFVGGTIIFDALQLRTVDAWHDGFVRSSPQNYFGLYWHAQGTPAKGQTDRDHPLRYRSSADAPFTLPEPAVSSDPNAGTRFDGYRIGRSFVRLHYRQNVGENRIQVVEEVRVESGPAWEGVIRDYRFPDLPNGMQVALALPASEGPICIVELDDTISGSSASAETSPLLTFDKEGKHYLARHRASDGSRWEQVQGADDRTWQLVSRAANGEQPVMMRAEIWRYKGSSAQPTASELGDWARVPYDTDESLDQPIQPRQPLSPLPEWTDTQETKPARPAVQSRENVDLFSPVVARFLRFTIKRTSDGAEPGLDELEVYGPSSDTNLALQAQASASSVIAGYSIHQTAHLNDGQLGNDHSWISAEPNGGSVVLEFPSPVEMSKVVWARDRTGVCGDRLIVSYVVEISDDGQVWRRVSDEEGREPWGSLGTVVQRDAAVGYEMESIPGPFPTWRPSDVLFDQDGTMYAIAMTEGQIWRSRVPPVGQPQRVQWQRVASGLYHPTGLALVNGRLFVAQKPEITELVDRDGDGVIDEYRTVATGWGLSTGWHEYCFGLAVDANQDLWFALNTGYFWTNPGFVNPGRWRGSVFRVELATETLHEMATGCRVPNGIAPGPDGGIYFTDNQGDWIQACKLAHVVPGRFYGHPETADDALPANQYPSGRSAVWLPYEHCRSVSGPVLDTTGGKFGPFEGQLFVGDVGYGANPGVMRVALEIVNGEYQGACFRFVAGQPLGCQRMRFGPDHQLYQTSLTSGLTRMAFNGRTPMSMKSVHIRPRGEGFVVKLTQPLDPSCEPTPEQLHVTRYHYLYTGNYGSPKADEQSVSVEKVEISADRTELTLSLPVETYPIGMVYQLDLGRLRSATGEELQHSEAWYTVYEIPE